MEANHDARPVSEGNPSARRAPSHESEASNTSKLSHTHLDPELTSPPTESSRFGSHNKSYSRSAFNGSIELSSDGEFRYYTNYERLEYWRNREEQEELNVQRFECLLFDEDRLPVLLENLIVSGTVLAIWSDMVHDVLIPQISKGSANNTKTVRPRMKSKFVRGVFYDNIRPKESTMARLQAYMDLRKLFTEQEKSFYQELSAAVKFFSAFFGRANGEEARYPVTITCRNLRDSVWAITDTLNTLLAHRVGKFFAAGMWSLDRGRGLTHHFLPYLQDTTVSTRVLFWDDPCFVRELESWLDEETRKRGREIFDELVSTMAQESQAMSQMMIYSKNTQAYTDLTY